MYAHCHPIRPSSNLKNCSGQTPTAQPLHGRLLPVSDSRGPERRGVDLRVLRLLLRVNRWLECSFCGGTSASSMQPLLSLSFAALRGAFKINPWNTGAAPSSEERGRLSHGGVATAATGTQVLTALDQAISSSGSGAVCLDQP